MARPSGDFETEVLAAHNEERATKGVPPLVWNEDLARDAAGWAGTLKESATLRHAGVQGQGENLWTGTRNYFAPATMVGDWIEEKADYRPGRFPDISRTGKWSDVGHYTQIIWRNTREVGCAVATDAEFDYLVCRYFRRAIGWEKIRSAFVHRVSRVGSASNPFPFVSSEVETCPSTSLGTNGLIRKAPRPVS